MKMEKFFECQTTERRRFSLKMPDCKNVRIEILNPWEIKKDAWIAYVRSLQKSGKMTDITSEAIIAVLDDIQENQVIRTRDVQKVLNCKETKALRIVSEMKKEKIIVAVTGQGKGKYVLNLSI